MSNFCPDTGGEGGHLFRLTCSVLQWGGRNTASKPHWRVWGVLAVSQPQWVCPAHGVCAFMFYAAQALGCSAGELSEAGPGLRVLPGLSCSGSGSRALHKGADSVGPAFCALPRSEQLSRPGAWQSQSPPGGEGISSPPPSHMLGFLGGSKSAVSGVLCVLWGADLWLRPSRWMRTIQSKKAWLAAEPACSLVEDASLGLPLPPSGSGCPCWPFSGGGWAGPSRLALLWYSLSPLFRERAWQCLRLGLMRDSSLFFSPSSLWLSHSLGC